MGMLDGLLGNLGNLDELAGKLGIPADKVQAIVGTFQEKLGQGGDHFTALTEAAQEHGLSLDDMQGMLGNLGGSAQDLLGKATAMLNSEGDGNVLDSLGGMAKGLFGKD